MKRLLRFFALLSLLGVFAAAQSAVVSRNSNLRPDASTSNGPIAKLKPGAKVQLLESDSRNGYFHVSAKDGKEGWVWGRNIQIQSVQPNVEPHVGPAYLYPNSHKTPGLADTLSLEDLTKTYTEHCPGSKPSCTYSQAHRNVPASVHTQVYDEYDVPQAKRNIRNGEVDHFYPLCAGGSNDIKNLWYQPAINEWNGKDFGYHAKDKLETLVCQQIKAGKLDPKEAYRRITTDWVKFYVDEGLEDEN